MSEKKTQTDALFVALYIFKKFNCHFASSYRSDGSVTEDVTSKCFSIPRPSLSPVQLSIFLYIPSASFWSLFCVRFFAIGVRFDSFFSFFWVGANVVIIPKIWSIRLI